MEALKPCPICGGTNLATSYCAYTNMDHEFMPDTVHMHVFDLYCKECGCRVQAGGDTYYEAKDAVFEKWNRRVECTCRIVSAKEAGRTGYAPACSSCGWQSAVWHQYSYCPNCGAKVVGCDDA